MREKTVHNVHRPSGVRTAEDITVVRSSATHSPKKSCRRYSRYIETRLETRSISRSSSTEIDGARWTGSSRDVHLVYGRTMEENGNTRCLMVKSIQRTVLGGTEAPQKKDFCKGFVRFVWSIWSQSRKLELESNDFVELLGDTLYMCLYNHDYRN